MAERTKNPRFLPNDKRTSPARSKAGLRRIIVVAVPSAVALDIVGPVTVFISANRLLKGQSPGYDIEVVTAGKKCLISDCGLSLSAQHHFRDVRAARGNGSVDTLLMVGDAEVSPQHNPELIKWLRKMAPRVRRLGSICIGAFVLAEAGLLHQKQATTHWAWTNELAARYPDVKVNDKPIWVQDGKIYTSAGVTAGMDLALALVEEDYGSALAREVAKRLVVFLRRPGGQAQFNARVADDEVHGVTSIRELQAWIAEHPDEDLSVEALAAQVAMSPRNFARVFVQELGVTPAKYVQEMRLQHARRLLERTRQSLDEIATACGFGSAEVMRRAFLKALTITPHRYRGHFGDLRVGGK